MGYYNNTNTRKLNNETKKRTNSETRNMFLCSCGCTLASISYRDIVCKKCRTRANNLVKINDNIFGWRTRKKFR